MSKGAQIALGVGAIALLLGWYGYTELGAGNYHELGQRRGRYVLQSRRTGRFAAAACVPRAHSCGTSEWLACHTLETIWHKHAIRMPFLLVPRCANADGAEVLW